jgi:hypothetical protein
MKGIINTNKNVLDIINKKINDSMKIKIPNYSAIQWSKIIKHPTKNKFMLIINTDSRNPLKHLTTNEKTERKEINKLEWLPDNNPYRIDND